MKKAILSVFTIVLFLGQATAEERYLPTVTLSSYVADKYLQFGKGSVLSKDPVVQSDLFISWKNGLFVDLWNSRSLRGSWDDGSLGNEIDYGVGWKGTLATNLSLAVGVTYFDEPRAFTFGAGDILYSHAFLTRDFKHLSVTAGYENYVTMPRSGFRGGNLISLGVSKSQSFCKDRIGLRTSVAGVYDTGTLGTDSGLILRGSAGADWNVTKRLTVNVIGVNWYVPLTSHDKRTTDAMVYSGLTFKF
ncbi:MAG: TorF family putative porin [bacterium]|nr:TorF family putative porin [bacterium]